MTTAAYATASVDVAVIGAGVAGAFVAKAFRGVGREVAWIGPENREPLPVALLHEYGGRSFGISETRRKAFAHACEVLHSAGVADTLDMVRPLSGASGERLVRSAHHLRDSGTEHAFFSAEQCRDQLAPLLPSAAVRYRPALSIRVGEFLASAAREVKRYPSLVDGLRQVPAGWHVVGAGLELVASEVILAPGCEADRWFPDLDVSRMPGTIAAFSCAQRLPFAVSAKGYYLLPFADGCVMGAARDLQQPIAELVRAAEKIVGPTIIGQERWRWSGQRLVANRDRTPYVGEIRPGLSVVMALGSKGFLWSAFAAEMLARGQGRPGVMAGEICAARHGDAWHSPLIESAP